MIVNKTALMVIIQPLTGLAVDSVSWAKNPQGMVSDVDQAKITLSLRSYASNGIDEHRREYDDSVNPATYTTTEEGQRNVILTLKCEAFDYNVEASEILENVKIQLHTTDNVDALNAIDLAFQSYEIATDLPTTYDNRVVNVAVMDIHFGALSEFSVVQTGQGWIDDVNSGAGIPGDIEL